MKYVIITLTLLVMSSTCYSQQFIKPGQTKRITATEDTLYIITIHQMRQAVTSAKERDILEEQSEIFQERISLLQQQTAEIDSLKHLHQEDALFYKDNWKQAEEDLQEALDEARRQRRNKYVYGAGGLLIGLVFTIL